MSQDLDAITGHLASVDAQLAAESAGPSAEAPADAPPVDQAAELSALLTMAVHMLTPALPFLPKHYTPQVCTSLGAALAAVAEKRGWALQDFMTPEVALAVAALPPTIGAVVEGRAYFAAMRAQQAQQGRLQAAPPPAPPPPAGEGAAHAG